MALRDLLTEFKSLEPKHQVHVQRLIPESVTSSISLQRLLAQKSPELVIFTHIVQHIHQKLSSDLIESYLFHLVETENLNAATSLVHIILQENAELYKLSNQFWSLLASKATELGHHQAASLIFHEIVDPYAIYTRDTVAGLENEFVPFLLLPNAIAQLALVYMHNGNVQAIQGLRAYFKRFYSYFGHRDVYETLVIAEVEAFAISGDLAGALQSYIDLAHKYRGHLRYRDPKDAARYLKSHSFHAYQKRKSNIKHNVSTHFKDIDPLQQATATEDSLKLYQPDTEFNKYTRPDQPYWAILDGYIHLADLPNFQHLLRDNIQQLVAGKTYVIDRLMSFISSHHHSLHRFVVASLCDVGHVEEACAVVNKLPELYPRIHKSTLFRGSDEFVCILRELRRQFDGQSRKDGNAVRRSKEYDDLLWQIRILCQQVFGSKRWPLACRQSFLCAMLASPFSVRLDVETFLYEWQRQQESIIALDQQSYDRMVELGVDSQYIESALPTLAVDF